VRATAEAVANEAAATRPRCVLLIVAPWTGGVLPRN
jgi:hypothetical protein